MKSVKVFTLSLIALLGTAGCVVDVSPGYGGYYYESYEYCPPPRVIYFEHRYHSYPRAHHGHGHYRGWRDCR